MSIWMGLLDTLGKKQALLSVAYECLSLHNFNNWTPRKKGEEMDWKALNWISLHSVCSDPPPRRSRHNLLAHESGWGSLTNCSANTSQPKNQTDFHRCNQWYASNFIVTGLEIKGDLINVNQSLIFLHVSLHMQKNQALVQQLAFGRET